MHRLVHLATRLWIEEKGDHASTNRIAIKHLEGILPDVYFHNRKIWRSYLPHVARMVSDENCQELVAFKGCRVPND